MPGEQVDGNDVLAVRAAVGQAVARARSGGGPSLIDALTYPAHGGYRKLVPREQSQEEIALWRKKDPLERLERKLLADNIITEGEIAACHAQAEREVAAASAEAVKAALPKADELDPDLVYARA